LAGVTRFSTNMTRTWQGVACSSSPSIGRLWTILGHEMNTHISTFVQRFLHVERHVLKMFWRASLAWRAGSRPSFVVSVLGDPDYYVTPPMLSTLSVHLSFPRRSCN
jgi:hypothetical protein